MRHVGFGIIRHNICQISSTLLLTMLHIFQIEVRHAPYRAHRNGMQGWTRIKECSRLFNPLLRVTMGCGRPLLPAGMQRLHHSQTLVRDDVSCSRILAISEHTNALEQVNLSSRRIANAIDPKRRQYSKLQRPQSVISNTRHVFTGDIFFSFPFFHVHG